MALAVTVIVLIYSVFRGWQNAIFPFVLFVFLNPFEWWLRLREPLFLQHSSVLDIFFLFLVGLSLARHALPDLHRQLRLTSVETIIIIVIIYSWISLTWSSGVEIIKQVDPEYVRKSVVNTIVCVFMLPMLFRASLGKHGFERDFTVVGLTVLPLIALTTDWQERGASYLFTVIDPETEQLESSSNALTTSFFGEVMIIFAACYMRKSLRSILTLALVMGLGFYLLIQTQSRGQIFSCLLCLPLIAMFLRPAFRTRHLLLLVPLLLPILAAVALNIGSIFGSFLELAGFPESYLERVSAETMTDDIGYRLNLIKILWGYWSASPSAIFFGLGTAASFDYVGMYIHNVIVEVLFEQGIIIFMLFIYAVFRTIAAMAMMLNIDGITNDDKRLGVFYSALFLILLLLSLKQGSLSNSYTFLMIMIFCAILADHLKRKYAARNALRLSTPVPQSGVNWSNQLPKEI